MISVNKALFRSNEIISSAMLSVNDNSPITIVVVVVETDDSTPVIGPFKGSVVDVVLKSGIVVVVDNSSIQLVIFLNFPTLLFEPKASLVIILALYFAPSGTPEIVVMNREEPAGIVYALSLTLLLFMKILIVNCAATFEFVLFIDKP